MLLLGIDLGTSSIKVSVADAADQRCIVTVQYPDTETPIVAKHPGWAEQSPDMWWEHVQQAILKAHATKKYDPKDIGAIGIAYQMHGLVLLDKSQQVLRDAIIWCDSRAVEIGEKAFAAIGHSQALQTLLNSPGNFTAAKLAWVKQYEPAVYDRIDAFMLPGDFIATRLTGTTTTSISALSEGVFWDFRANAVSADVMQYFGFSGDMVPPIKPVFSEHGQVTATVAEQLGLKAGIPVSYKAGDQPNNALSLNVLEPGEVAATAGTSGVIYGVSDQLTFDPQSRVNSFAHVNHDDHNIRTGVLLCINGTGILNRFTRDIFGKGISYPDMNREAASIQPGSNGLFVLPFGNGAERMLNNRLIGAHFERVDFNIHQPAHFFRASQEGIAFAFRYGLDIMRENGMNPAIIRAGHTNLFLSDLFTAAFVNATGVPVELHLTDGSMGAALGAGIGAGVFKSQREAFAGMKATRTVEPSAVQQYDELYGEWKNLLERQLA